MRGLLVPLLLLTAGCVAPTEPAEGADPGATGRANVLPWTLNECRYIVGWSDADPSVIQENLPEGFTVRAGLPMGVPLPAPGPTARAIIGTEAFECASGSGLDGEVEPMTYASIWIPVTPPDALAIDGIDMVYYKIDVLVPDAPRREAMVAKRLPVADGAIAWDTATVPNGVAADLTIATAGDFRLELEVAQEVGANDPAEFMEITPAGEMGADGFAVWRATFSWDEDTYSQGRGFIDWPADHWVTEAIGAPRAPASFHAGVWSFQGDLILPMT